MVYIYLVIVYPFNGTPKVREYFRNPMKIGKIFILNIRKAAMYLS